MGNTLPFATLRDTLLPKLLRGELTVTPEPKITMEALT